MPDTADEIYNKILAAQAQLEAGLAARLAPPEPEPEPEPVPEPEGPAPGSVEWLGEQYKARRLAANGTSAGLSRVQPGEATPARLDPILGFVAARSGVVVDVAAVSVVPRPAPPAPPEPDPNAPAPGSLDAMAAEYKARKLAHGEMGLKPVYR